jgi:acetoin utilization protein AcuC
MAIAIIYREELKEYDFGSGHSFRGDRYEIFPKFLKEHIPEDGGYVFLKSEPATDEDLLLISQEEYIEFTKEYYKAANLGLSYPGPFYRFQSQDNLPFSRPGKLEEAARLIVGQAKMACNLVQGGDHKKAVSVGGGMHHAKPSYGEGFCLYNDVAFCALYLMQQCKLERVLILDTDAHAGNGTAEYFYEEPRVLFIDLHQDPRTVYPGTGFVDQIGTGRGKGYTVNVPLPVNAGFDSYQLVFDHIVQPLVKEFQPQIIIRNGGSDPHPNDQLTRLSLPVKGFRMIGAKVREMASICDGKVVDLIASGYNKHVLPYAWLALITGLAGIEFELEEPEPIYQVNGQDVSLASTEQLVKGIRDELKDYWKSMS